MLSVPYFGHRLLAVPAVHYRAVFAEQVNRICADVATRPDAIAVELGPSAAAAVANWMKELGIGTGPGQLPCMLGIMRQNRRIHPKFKAAAKLLQETTGQPLQALSPDLLHRELGYAATALLCLSPTDSIIEAIRCAIELDVPLYGIDLEEPATIAQSAELQLRDPIAARSDFAAYVKRTERDCSAVRDEYCDGRRETVMAARLKTLLTLHKRVLFTGGLAHWQNICRMLADEAIKPACEVPLQGMVEYKRVVVHPKMAIQQMDLFPGITACYEAARQSVRLEQASRNDVDFQLQFRQCLERASANFYNSKAQGTKSERAHESQHGLARFGGYLMNRCLLSERLTPDLYTAVSSAKAMMPAGFVAALTDALMDFHWASPADYPQQSVVGPGDESRAEERPGVSKGVLKIPRSRPSDQELAYEQSTPFYIQDHYGAQGRKLTGITWKWRDEPPIASEDPGEYDRNFIWPPCENLFYASIYESVNAADAMRMEKQTEAFSGSLYDGIDLKASLRSALQGEHTLCVKRTLRSGVRLMNGEPVKPRYSGQIELQPTVFIFSGEEDIPQLNWQILNPGDLRIYDDLSTRGQKMLDQIIASGDRYLVESIHAAEKLDVPDHMKPWVKDSSLLHGSIRFGNPCVNFFQSAVWLEKGRFKAAPSYGEVEGIQGIIEMYRKRQQMEIDLTDWKNALVQFGLPYAHTTHRLVVVAPADFRIDKDVLRDAKQRKVEIVTIPLTLFPVERIRQIRRQYSVAAKPGGKEYPPELNRIFGQRATQYQELLPRQIAKQARPNNRRREAVVLC